MHKQLTQLNLSPAEIDVYNCDMHDFDMLQSGSDLAQEAAQRFEEWFERAVLAV